MAGGGGVGSVGGASGEWAGGGNCGNYIRVGAAALAALTVLRRIKESCKSLYSGNGKEN